MIRLITSLSMILLVSSCAWFTSKAPKEEVKEPPESNIAPEVLVTAENYVTDGIAFYGQKDYTSAINSWKHALELIPGDAEVHNFIGIAYHKTNKLNDAATQFKLATELDPGYFEAYNNLGYILFLQNNYDEASRAFSKALEINPSYDPAKLNYERTKNVMNGKIQREVFELTEKAKKLDDVDLKIQYYKKILAMDSNYAEAHNNIAVAYYYADNLDSAYFHLNKALQLKDDYPEAINNLGYIYKVAGRYQDAIKLFLKAISLKERYIIALNNLGETYYLNKEIENARRVFKTVLEVDPSDEFAKDSLVKLDEIKE
jgi:Flp pilus assembly protein TadD